MPRPRPVADINYLTKTEKMTNLPISYYLKNKTERMVDLPALYYGNNVPALETNGLIYFLDGVGYSKVGSIWYNSADKAGVSKTSATLVGATTTFGPPNIIPIQEEKSFRLVNNLTGALVTDLSSDLFNISGLVFTLSSYFKVNNFSSAITTRLFSIARTSLANTSWGVYFTNDNNNPGIYFRAIGANLLFRIDLNKKYLATVVYNGSVFSYYLNNQLVYSEPFTAFSTPTPPSTNVVVGSGVFSSAWINNFTSSSNIYSFSAYNRVLSAQEISNNYQYFKQRYE
jgi:hypothetical protein